MDQDALQWHFALQTYGLPRPDRAGWFVIYRALGRQWGPGMPSFLTIPVGDTTTVQSLLDAIEGGWQDLRCCDLAGNAYFQGIGTACGLEVIT